MGTHLDSTLRGELQTGDIVLFSGKGGVSDWIKWFTRGTWSHVGMVVRVPDWDMVMLWESTTLSNLPDIESGKETKGVQLVSLSKRIQTYKGEVAVRRLNADRTPAMLRALQTLRREVAGRQYEADKIELIRAALDGPFGANREDLSSLFCSELVAEAYQRMGLLPDGTGAKPSNEYTPKDFSNQANPALPLLVGELWAEEALR